MEFNETIKAVIDWLGETHGSVHGAPAPNWFTLICLMGIVWFVVGKIFKK